MHKMPIQYKGKIKASIFLTLISKIVTLQQFFLNLFSSFSHILQHPKLDLNMIQKKVRTAVMKMKMEYSYQIQNFRNTLTQIHLGINYYWLVSTVFSLHNSTILQACFHLTLGHVLYDANLEFSLSFGWDSRLVRRNPSKAFDNSAMHYIFSLNPANETHYSVR